MKRIMVNLDDPTGLLVEERARAQKRSASAHIALLIENDLHGCGLLNRMHGDPAEFAAKVTAAVAADPQIKPEIESVIKRRTRIRRTAA